MRFPLKFSAKFLSDARWSLFSNLAGIIINLATVKLVTHLVAVDIYGRVSLVNGVLTLLNGLLVGPIMASHNRLFFDYRQRNMEEWYVKIFQYILNGVAAASALIYVVAALLFCALGKNAYWSLIIPSIVLIGVQPYISGLSSYLEAQRKQKALAVSGVIQKTLYPLLLILLIKLSVSQATALLLSQAAAIIAILIAFRNPLGYKITKKILETSRSEVYNLRDSILNFGWPIAISFMTMWVITSSDKYFIEYFMGAKSVGIYAINYSLWSIPFLVLNGWLEILTRPMIYERVSKGDWIDAKRVLKLRIILGTFASIGMVAVLFVLSPFISSMLLSHEYWCGAGLVLSISVAYCFHVIGYSIVPLFLAAKRPIAMTVTTAIAAVINVSSNIILIPRWGLIGAAISTLIAYVAWAIMLMFSVKKIR